MKRYVAVSILLLVPDTDHVEQVLGAAWNCIAPYTSNWRLFLIDEKKADSISLALKWSSKLVVGVGEVY